MKRRHTKDLRLDQQQRPGESWGQWIHRLFPKQCAAAELRLTRSELLYRWPRVNVVKATYRRRRRAR
ncbi:hypothetical protein [Sphaerisporangium album]|uniref:hypothetical protein n=1 Tax=Sphaerisporangium album TaxID=509200 RepID=UPI0011C02BA4|nr:hypothetical protein [Sphaerisporangium album]